MRNSLDIDRKYQFGYMILQHIKAVLVCMLLEMVAFYSLLEGNISRLIVSTVFTVLYAIMMYSAANRLSKFDNKTYTPLEPSLKYGILWGIVISATMIVSIIVFKLNWAFVSNMTLRVILNLLCYFWTGPYFGFYGNRGELPIYAIILMVAVPIVATTLGYIAGNKKFDVLEKLDSMTFEKDEDEE